MTPASQAKLRRQDLTPSPGFMTVPVEELHDFPHVGHALPQVRNPRPGPLATASGTPPAAHQIPWASPPPPVGAALRVGRTAAAGGSGGRPARLRRTRMQFRAAGTASWRVRAAAPR